MKAIGLSIVVGAVLALSGCLPPVTTHPVGTTAGLVNDPGLAGLWRARMASQEAGKPPVYFHFLPTADGAITVVIVGGGEPDGGWMVASITTAKLGAYRFMNARIQFSDGKQDAASDTTTPLLYRFDGSNRVSLFLMDEDATKAAIKAGEIAGTVGEGEYGDATITADPKSLDSFMASKHGVAPFGKPFAVLTRLQKN